MSELLGCGARTPAKCKANHDQLLRRAIRVHPAISGNHMRSRLAFTPQPIAIHRKNTTIHRRVKKQPLQCDEARFPITPAEASPGPTEKGSVAAGFLYLTVTVKTFSFPFWRCTSVVCFRPAGVTTVRRYLP